MQIVIDIDENVFTRLFDNCTEDYEIVNDDLFAIAKSIRKCTPLPKGHGDLIDRNEIEYLKAIHDLKWGKITANECAKKIKYSAPIIVEADTEESEEV